MCDFHNFGVIFAGQCTPLAPSELLRSKKFQAMLTLAFEVIVQPPKTHFLMFSSETKIMEVTHSDRC